MSKRCFSDPWDLVTIARCKLKSGITRNPFVSNDLGPIFFRILVVALCPI